jgi:hypothetical protein
MDRLASCYFCGTALDAPLAEEPVVPEDLGAASGRTVTLCPTCSRKLEAVMDEVRGVLEGDSDGMDTAWASDSPTAVESEPDPEQDAESGPEAEAESDPEAEAESAPTEDASEPLESTSADEESESSSDGADPPSVADRADSPADDEPSPAPSADATAEVDEEAPTNTASQDATPPANDPSIGEAAGEAEPEDEEGEEADADRTISALENSKVMRMLENREFPVERDSFQAVAANAYGVGEAQVAQVLDMAIDRGLLAESDGMLVRPD